jgi:hypothetical protein
MQLSSSQQIVMVDYPKGSPPQEVGKLEWQGCRGNPSRVMRKTLMGTPSL